MVTLGVTPVEAAFEVIGLTNCKLVMDFLFKETLLGVTVFAAGFIMSLWQSVQKGSFGIFFKFIFLFLFIWFIFIVPVTGRPTPHSTMEKFGYKELQAEDIVKSRTEGEQVPVVLLTISRAFNAISIGIIKAISFAARDNEYNYLKNPFFLNKMAVQLNRFAGEGIRDKLLKEDVISFFYDEYLPTISIMSKKKNINLEDVHKWWPGHEEVAGNYSSRGRKKWDGLRKKLYDYVEKQSFWEKAMDWLKEGNKEGSSEDRMLISLFNSEIQESSWRMTSRSGGAGKGKKKIGGGIELNGLFKGLGFVATTIGQFFTIILAEAMLKMLPYIEGYACLIMYSFFPVTLLFCMLLRSGKVLFEYFKLLFWVKSWVIIWGVIHYASRYMAEIQDKLSPGVGWIWERPYFNAVTAIFIIMTPAIAGYFMKGFVQGIGHVGEASIVHQEKMQGKTEGIATKLT